MIKPTITTMFSVLCFLHIAGCTSVGARHSAVDDTRGRETLEQDDSTYIAVLWGTLKMEEGESPILINVREIIAMPAIFPYPFDETQQELLAGRYRLPSLNEYHVGTPGSIRMPLKYVPGRRYQVFFGIVPKMHVYKPGDVYLIRDLEVIDLDETLLEMRTRLMYRQTSGRAMIPRISRKVDRQKLFTWVEETKNQIETGDVSVPDLVEALGEPASVRQIGEGTDYIETEGAWPLWAAEKLVERTEKTFSFPVLIIQARGAKVTRLELRMHDGHYSEGRLSIHITPRSRAR